MSPSGQYCGSVSCALLAGLSQLFLGATLMVILRYLVNSGFSDLHIVLCSFGFHFFSVEAILSLNYANGWSAPMRLKHRRYAHVFLQLCGMACAVTGTVLAVLDKGVSMKLHGLTGLIAAALAGASVLSGLIAFLGNRPGLIICHIFFGLPAFITASISLCSILFSATFKTFAGNTIVYILIAFILFYTVFIVASSLLKYLSRC